MMHSSNVEHEVVLLGIGHTNAHVLRRWRMDPYPGARLTCVSNYPVATYSGMLPGVLAGQYAANQMEIDLVRLCAAARARLVVGHVMGLDREARQLLFDDRAPLPYDVLSIGIGSIPQADRAERRDGAVVPIKPMQTFLSRLESRLDELSKAGVGEIRIVIVGGGAGGTEIAFCVGPRLNLVLRHVPYRMTLIHGTEQLIPGVSRKTSTIARRELERRGVELMLGRRVTGVAKGNVTLDDGREIQADMVVWATTAMGSPLLGKMGLATDERGFLVTRSTLQTRDDDSIFAVGDSATIEGCPVPKAGVYAVRQGPVLWRNLRRRLEGKPLQAYRPQRGFLKLFNTGDGRAIGEYKGATVFAPWAWRLKNWIDTRFMAMYQDYAPAGMNGVAPARRLWRLDALWSWGRLPWGERATGPRGTDRRTVASGGQERGQAAVPRCLGCGGKIGSSVLARVLSKLDVPVGEDVVVGLQDPDDAAVVRVPAGGLVSLTVDFFVPPLEDLFIVGRIAALNAASDCFAMGARPIAALACVTLPVGAERQQEQALYELLAGALHEFRPMATTLAGGHTIEGPTATIGFSMLAVHDSPPRTKGNLRVGDFLILTKPLGIGILLAAHMQARCRAEWWDSMLHAMLLSNQYAGSLCDEFSIQGVTDVTGFGLAGHLLEMLRASQVAAEIHLNNLPLLPGVAELVAEGLESSLAPANRVVEAEMSGARPGRRCPRYAALFDPQTNGGLLLGVPEQHVHGVLARLGQQSNVPATMIGRVTAAEASAGRLHLRDGDGPRKV